VILWPLPSSYNSTGDDSTVENQLNKLLKYENENLAGVSIVKYLFLFVLFILFQ